MYIDVSVKSRQFTSIIDWLNERKHGTEFDICKLLDLSHGIPN